MIEGQRGCGVKYNKRKAPNKRNTKRPATNHQQNGWELQWNHRNPKSPKKSQLKRKKRQRKSMEMMGERCLEFFYMPFKFQRKFQFVYLTIAIFSIDWPISI